jgi:cytochrome P450
VDTVSERNSSSTALSSIPLSAWENENPVLDMVVREAVRLSQAFVAFRRNVGPGMYIDGKVIPTGALVAYPAADVHLDPALYPDPWKFDPARPQPKGNLTYLSWGVGACLTLAISYQKGSLMVPPAHGLGRTTCIDVRLARLNTKLIVALLLVDFDFYTVLDMGGKIVDSDSAPKPDWNDPLGCRPVEDQFFLRYTRLDDPESRVADCRLKSRAR